MTKILMPNDAPAHVDYRHPRARRERLCADVPPCPKCWELRQIQLVDYYAIPARWRCRLCRHKFTYDRDPKLGEFIAAMRGEIP